MAALPLQLSDPTRPVALPDLKGRRAYGEVPSAGNAGRGDSLDRRMEHQPTREAAMPVGFREYRGGTAGITCTLP